MAYIIGEGTPAGAVTLAKEDEVDLSTDCGNPRCPSVVIFDGEQEGTQEMVNCYAGQLSVSPAAPAGAIETLARYTFINKSKRDNGIIVQHKGGRFGSKSIPQYGVGQCFCFVRTHDDDRIEQEGFSGYSAADQMASDDGSVNASEPTQDIVERDAPPTFKGSGGILLCG
ncbi:hypothetical protein FOZ61_002159 [Perkinsus olseni]|uniref:Uncharacterized protein n=1 Tax=Perkinsus olseni TaxID=32597 RepID=A0A7J6LUX9_PEROL|nr:hypothetical protein FOZ61_002159 [Perkinsus olseni]KAF4670627.1 hypothetical protein FOL46_000720 [Perkinsus olseni]